MIIGVSGHRWRDGADWEWVRAKFDEIIVSAGNVTGYTSLAPGADQIFADAILAHEKRLVAVAPVCRGRIELNGGEKAAFDRLCFRAAQIIEVDGASPDEAFLNAGKRVADECATMIFVWDGNPSRGLGGTADIVAYAAGIGRRGVILDPIARTARPLASSDCRDEKG